MLQVRLVYVLKARGERRLPQPRGGAMIPGHRPAAASCSTDQTAASASTTSTSTPPRRPTLDVHFIRPPSAAQQAALTADRVSITAALGRRAACRRAQLSSSRPCTARSSCACTPSCPARSRGTRCIADPVAGRGRPVLRQHRVLVQGGLLQRRRLRPRRATHVRPEDAVDFPVDYQATRLLELPHRAARLRVAALPALG